jgi:hypothetical protein
MRVVLPLAIHDEPILIPAGRQPKPDFPDSGFIPAQANVTHAPVVEIPSHKDLFGPRGLASQFNLDSPSASSNLLLVIVPGGFSHRHGCPAIRVSFHSYFFFEFLLQNISCSPLTSNTNATTPRSSQL